MGIVKSLIAALSIVGSVGEVVGQDRGNAYTFDELQDRSNGTYSSFEGAVSWPSETTQFSETKAHEFDGAITLVVGGAEKGVARGGDLHHLGYRFLDFHAASGTKPPSVAGLAIKRCYLYYDDLLMPGNDFPFEVITVLNRVNEGETFHMPDNTEWNASLIDVKSRGIGFEVRAIPGTVDPGAKNSVNKILIVPLDSKVTLHVPSLFGPAGLPGMFVTISTRSSRVSKSGNLEVVVKGSSRLENNGQSKQIRNTEYRNVERGQKLELTPGNWHKILDVVSSDKENGIRGWIKLDTTPISSAGCLGS